jgi:hypothetical protein
LALKANNPRSVANAFTDTEVYGIRNSTVDPECVYVVGVGKTKRHRHFKAID